MVKELPPDIKIGIITDLAIKSDIITKPPKPGSLWKCNQGSKPTWYVRVFRLGISNIDRFYLHASYISKKNACVKPAFVSRDRWYDPLVSRVEIDASISDEALLKL